MPASRELKRALTRHLRVQPADAQEAYRELRSSGSYVPRHDDPRVLAEDPVEILFNTIDLQPQSSTVQLVSGFRGTGTTTNMLRLRDMLEDADYAAIRIDVKDYLCCVRGWARRPTPCRSSPRASAEWPPPAGGRMPPS